MIVYENIIEYLCGEGHVAIPVDTDLPIFSLYFSF